MTIKQLISSSKLGAWFRLWRNFSKEANLWKKWIYDSQKSCDQVKFKSDLIIKSHAIEKGMSIGKLKDGFGKNKVLSILSDLQLYNDTYLDKDFVCDVCGIIMQYIKFNNFNNEEDVFVKFELFCEKNSITPSTKGGVKVLSKEYIDNARSADFALFSQSRYAIRDFGNDKIELEYIQKALSLVEKTPSACNRQPWRVYVYSGENKKKLLELQKGSRGFWDDMQYAVLICGDMRYYNAEETNLLFVDGGLYAMNLMYALHFEGIANIPLTMGRRESDLEIIKNEMSIPEYEMPVIVIGVGSYKDSFKVAISERKQFNNYTTIR